MIAASAFLRARKSRSVVTGTNQPFFALNPSEAPARAEEFQRYIESPLLTSATLSVEGFDAYDIEPPALPLRHLSLGSRR